MNKIGKAKALAQRAREMLLEEMERHTKGTGTTGTVRQLADCDRQLQTMIRELESEKVPPKEQRARGMGHMIADSWPLDSILGDALLSAEQAYLAV